jgi:hypothetical protein
MQTGFRRIRIKTEIKNTFPVIAGMFLFLLAVSPYGVLLLLPPEDFRYALMKEDGFFETVAAACWLCCSAVFFYLYAADRSGNDFVLCKTRRNIFLLLLAGLFFAGFELNVHNLAGMKVESLFSLFWFSYAFIIPLLVRLSRPVAAFLNRINLPVMPLWIGALFPVNYLVSKLLEPYFSGTETNFPIEAKEFVFAMLFLAAGVSLVREYRAMRD